jgi:hypothetical protein
VTKKKIRRFSNTPRGFARKLPDGRRVPDFFMIRRNVAKAIRSLAIASKDWSGELAQGTIEAFEGMAEVFACRVYDAIMPGLVPTRSRANTLAHDISRLAAERYHHVTGRQPTAALGLPGGGFVGFLEKIFVAVGFRRPHAKRLAIRENLNVEHYAKDAAKWFKAERGSVRIAQGRAYDPRLEELRDDQLERLKEFMPSAPAGKPGRHSDDLKLLDALLWKVRSRAPWSKLPEEFGKHDTISRGCYRLLKRGVLDAMLAALKREE